jgi:hypothetical protein
MEQVKALHFYCVKYGKQQFARDEFQSNCSNTVRSNGRPRIADTR